MCGRLVPGCCWGVDFNDGRYDKEHIRKLFDNFFNGFYGLVVSFQWASVLDTPSLKLHACCKQAVFALWRGMLTSCSHGFRALSL